MSETTTFLNACLYGQASVSDVDDWVDRWHETDGAPDGEAVSLAQYLGLTDAEYAQWVTDGSILKDVVIRRAYEHRVHTMQYIGDSTWSDQPIVEVARNVLAS